MTEQIRQEIDEALELLAPRHVTREYRPADAAADKIRKAFRALRDEIDRRNELLKEWGQYTGLRARAFSPDIDQDDGEYASGRDLIQRTDLATGDE